MLSKACGKTGKPRESIVREMGQECENELDEDWKDLEARYWMDTRDSRRAMDFLRLCELKNGYDSAEVVGTHS